MIMYCKLYEKGSFIGRCNGTREHDCCVCGGDELKCDFYPEVRDRAQQQITEYKVKEAINLLKKNGYVIYKEV